MPRSTLDHSQTHFNTTDPIANDDLSAGYNIGSEWINTASTPIRFWKCVDATIGAAVWQQQTTPFDVATVSENNAGGFVSSTMNNVALYNLINATSNRATDSNPVFFNPSGNDYIECTSATYEVRANVIYRGTQVWTPDVFLLMVSRSGSTGIGYFRMYDYDNARIIFERSFTNVAKTTHVYTLTPAEIALFPATTAALEYQLRRDGNSKIYLHAAGLYADGGA